jgi:3'-phosphoadenosine 5'-phosphosulfate (PAPS) 3'-phosphatase
MQHLYEDILPILEQAWEIAMWYFNIWIDIQTKDNDTPVTQADTKFQPLIRDLIDIYNYQKSETYDASLSLHTL